MQATHLIVALVFVGVAAGVVGLVSFTLRPSAERKRTRSRLQELSREDAPSRRILDPDNADPAPSREDQFLRGLGSRERTTLQERLTRAGFNTPNALWQYITVRMALMIGLPCIVGVTAYLTGWLSDNKSALAAVVAAAVSFVGPGIWLEQRIRRRKDALRRALPDALDMLVLCLEGGLSLRGALQRVTCELEGVHPLLGSQMQLMQSKMQLGLGAGEAMKQFADESDLEEARQLSSVLIQAERYGASTAKALRTYADSFRQERQHVAEEMAQKAAVKILFPTLLCIFPANFIVILGPAAVQISRLFAR